MERTHWLFVCCLVALSTPSVDSSLHVMRRILLVKRPHVIKMRNISEASEGSTLHFIALVEQHGYPAEEHNVTSHDGYISTLHRIPNSPLSQTSPGEKPVIFLQHGFLCSSDAWVLHNPMQDLAFLLADAGFDVWIGNARGNSYSNTHLTLTIDDPKYWHFSFHEMALNDMPVVIDYILNTTGRKTLKYIGHSMGTSIIFILLSMKPEYNEKVSLAVTLAPVSNWVHKDNTFFEETFATVSSLKKSLDELKIHDVLAQGALNNLLGPDFCKERTATQTFCLALYFESMGWDVPQLNKTLFPHYLKYLPAGAATQTIYHYNQNIKSHEFKAFDYDEPSENYNNYNQTEPVHYPLENITAPIAVFYGPNDPLSTIEDVTLLSQRVRNIVFVEKVPFKEFSHIDFLLAKDARKILYDRLVLFVQRFRD